MERLFAFLAVFSLMFVLVRVVPAEWLITDAQSTLSFGFLILTAYLVARGLRHIGLPKITGYIVAGMVCGPSLLSFLTDEVIAELRLVDDLALTFIAFAAGGELRLTMLKERRRSIGYTLLCQMLLMLLGVTLTILALHSWFPLTAGASFVQALSIAAICGVISVARSPSSAIAIISETKSKGPFTDMILGVTVAADVLTIFLFALVVSFSKLLLSPGKSIDLAFLAGIGAEVAGSLVLGFVIGKGIALYLEKVRSELVIFILGMAFMIAKLSHWLAGFLDGEFGLQFHLEPMLICLAAGFYVQNRTRHGDKFLTIIDRSSLPIYAIFFAMSGAALKLEALRDTWHWALVLVALRGIFAYFSTYLGGRIAADPPRFQKASGFGFVTQAGVSLGLTKVVADKFDGFGVELATLLVAAIAINQVIGPVALKQALSFVGETKLARLRQSE